MFIGNPFFCSVSICLHFAWVDGVASGILTQGSSELGVNSALFPFAFCKGRQLFQEPQPLLLLTVFYPSSSEDSSNDVDLSDFSSDEDSSIQWPQTLAGPARVGSLFTSHCIYIISTSCLISDNCGITFMRRRAWSICSGFCQMHHAALHYHLQDSPALMYN